MEVLQYALPPTALVPNSPFPLLHYKNVLRRRNAAGQCDAAEAYDLFEGNGWAVQWLYRYGPTQHAHFHPWAHEAMAILSGTATIRFGVADTSSDDQDNTWGTAYEAGGVELQAAAGDVFVIPAGVAHKTHNTLPRDTFVLLTPGNGHGLDGVDDPRQVLAAIPLTGFTMIGAYPSGAAWTTLRSGGDFAKVWSVPKPARDPVVGTAEQGVAGRWRSEIQANA